MADKDELPSLEELDKSIKKAKEKAEDGEKKSSPAGDALRVSIELMAGVIVGSVIGFYIDKWLGTLPVFFIICFFLGVAGSALNIYRSIQRDNNRDK